MVAAGVHHIQSSSHAITDSGYIDQCRRTLDAEGALVMRGFFTPDAVQQVLDASDRRQSEAFFTTTGTHNVYLTPPDSNLPPDHVVNRQIRTARQPRDEIIVRTLGRPITMQRIEPMLNHTVFATES